MKFICALLAFMMLVGPAVVMAETVTFPYKMEGPGTFELVVPEGDTWTVRNEQTEILLKLEFSELKLNLEETIKLNEIDLAYQEKLQALELEKAKFINSIEIKYRDDKIEGLEDSLKKARSKSFLGISTNYWSFILGAVVTAGVTYAVNN